MENTEKNNNVTAPEPASLYRDIERRSLINLNRDKSSNYINNNSRSSHANRNEPVRKKQRAEFNKYAKKTPYTRHLMPSEIETDNHRLKQRQKQIDFGKNTVGYDIYMEKVPKNKRKRNQPHTPNKFEKQSKRSWDSKVRKWRQSLHLWDPKEDIDLNHIVPKYDSKEYEGQESEIEIKNEQPTHITSNDNDATVEPVESLTIAKKVSIFHEEDYDSEDDLL